MAYALEIKEQAILLRKEGMAIKKVAAELNISEGTASVWLRDVQLSQAALSRLENNQYNARIKSRETKTRQRYIREKEALLLANETLAAFNLKDKELCKLLCACLFWAEGSKQQSSVRFTNSDPRMIVAFLTFLRQGFCIDEKKLRVLVHLHEYHDEANIKSFWSKQTQIPLNQFFKSYIKPHTGKRKKAGYMGCIRINYFDVAVFLELTALYTSLSSRAGHATI